MDWADGQPKKALKRPSLEGGLTHVLATQGFT